MRNNWGSPRNNALINIDPSKSLPAWLRERRSPLRRTNKPDSLVPDDASLAIALRALRGGEAKEVASELGVTVRDVVDAVVRVRDAIVRSETPEAVRSEFPWLASFVLLGPKALQAKNGHTTPETRALALAQAIPPNVAERLKAITDEEYTSYDPTNPDTLEAFLEQVRHRSARILAPLAMRTLAENVALGGDLPVSKALEALYGVGHRNGPMVGIQVNTGREEAPKPIAGIVHVLEDTILECERTEGPQEGETVVFSDRMLEIQEKEETSDND